MHDCLRHQYRHIAPDARRGRSLAVTPNCVSWTRRSIWRWLGVRQVVLVTGEPGIGKTRIVTELAELAAARGARDPLG